MASKGTILVRRVSQWKTPTTELFDVVQSGPVSVKTLV